MTKSASRNFSVCVLTMILMSGPILVLDPQVANADAATLRAAGLIGGGVIGGAVLSNVLGGGAGVTSGFANLGSATDAMCIQKCDDQHVLAASQKNPALNCPPLGGTPIPCAVSSGIGGVVSGMCIYDVGCRATFASGVGGGAGGLGGNVLSGIGGIGQLLGGVAQLITALNGGSGGGGSGGGGTIGGSQGCTQYYQVSTPSTDPCAYYVPTSSTGGSGGASGTGTAASDLLNALGGSGNSSPISDLINSSSNNNTNSGSTSASTSTGPSKVLYVRQQVIQVPGLAGDMRVSPNGATILVSNPNIPNNTIVAGFLGANTGSMAESQDTVKAWCASRPWANGFLAFVIPPAFFDGLCTLRGYNAVQAAPTTKTPAVSLTQTKVAPKPKPVATTTPPVSTSTQQYPPGQADIWAVPATVALGSRTTVFWSSKNTSSCLVTSPDGSFNHNTLSGGGATVPLSGATTYTISCQSLDGSHVTDFVTVGISL